MERKLITYNAREYGISLRLCPDGYFSGYARSAVVNALPGVISARAVLGSPANTDLVMDAIAFVDIEGKVIARPWISWMELPAELLEELIGFFFSDLKKKTRQFSGETVDTRTRKAIDLICLTTTLSPGPSPTPLEAPENSAVPSTK